MLHQRTWARTAVRVCVASVLALGVLGCGQGAKPDSATKGAAAVKDCRAQWAEVGDSVLGLDQDKNPSALPDRWNTVIATVDYYKHTTTAKNCQQLVETQLKAITSLRQFSEKLRPYDMTYQLDQVRAAVDLYLSDPLPAAVRDANHKLVRPPTKAAVKQAMQTLSDNAQIADQELQPGWEQTKSVDLTDVEALTTTMQDLDFLAQDSPHWRQCEDALQVLVAGIRFQEGLAEGQAQSPSTAPTDATTPAG
ncbi:hypothetical protein ACVW00_002602 [Marmoricola sp. URHA0025 HA25]